MFEHARHFPGRSRYTGDGHYRMAIDFQNFVGTIVNDSVTRSRAPIARNQNAAREFESKNRGRFCRLPRSFVWRSTCGVEPTTAAGASKPLCRSSEGKSPPRQKNSGQAPQATCPLLDPCAGDSAWIGWGRPCAFFLRDPSCPVARRPVNAGRRHRLAWDPTELVQPAFEYARA